MAKDPAFLFYSKDFYEGTRLMLPEERACFIDLMIYQHQHGGFIPNDIKRMTMYCSGIDKATLEATLEAKFKLCDKGWYNEKLEKVINDRQEFSIKQSGNGLLGQFFKKAKTTINTSDYDKLKSYIFNEYGKEKLIEELKKDTNTYEAMLEALLKHLANVNENVNENVIGNKDNNIKFDFKKSLIDLGVDENIVNDYIIVRKNKRLSNTETAFKKINDEIIKSKRSANDVISICVEKSWGGFNHKWLDNVDEVKKEIPPFEFDFEKHGGDMNLFEKLKREHELKYS